MEKEKAAIKLLGDNIKRNRIKKNFSQEYLGELIGMSRMQINRIENGAAYPTTKNLFKISTALELSSLAVLFQEPDPEEKLPKRPTYKKNLIKVGRPHKIPPKPKDIQVD